MSVQTLIGDCREVLKTLPERSVNCIVTSPPYFRLRSYLPDDDPKKALEIGQEQTPDQFVAALVEVFRECRRVLRDDGVMFLNIGDSYAASGRGGNPEKSQFRKQATNAGSLVKSSKIDGLKPKDLIGIPWMLAFALRADGWYLRGDHVWAKCNAMPESVEDRPTRAHEYVFLLSQSERYWYDHKAVRTAPKASTITRLQQDIENQQGSTRANGGAKTNGTMKAVGAGISSSTITGGLHGRHVLGEAIPESERRTDKQRGHSRRHQGFNDRWDAMDREEQMVGGANLRSVWWVPSAQFKGAHYAVMPELVAEICIRAGCPFGGTVLDPFAGTGTVGAVAEKLGRNSVLIDLDGRNLEHIDERMKPLDAPLFAGAAEIAERETA